MPSFGRLSKHSNRSQHALPEQLSTTGETSGVVQAQQHQHQQHQPQPQPQPQAGSGVGVGAGVSATAGATVMATSSHAAQANSSAEALPRPALSSSTAHSSSDHLETSADSRSPPQGQQQLQHQQLQQQQPPPLPPHLFNTQTGGVNLPLSLQTSGPGGSPSFDGHQSQTPIDFGPGVSRSQSQRYGRPLSSQRQQPQQQQQHQRQQQQQQQQHHQQQQQQQVYGIASGSFDDLPNAGAHHQQLPPPPQQPSVLAPAAQKRSTRKLIKGIFGSSRESHDSHNHQQQPPPQPTGHNPSGAYDNTAGLARRPSKRVSKPPNLKTSFSQATQLPIDRDWHTPGTYSQQPSPLHQGGEAERYSDYVHGSNVDSPIQDSRIFLSSNGIRQVSGEHLETSLYDEVYQPPDHPPPHQQLHNQQPPPPLQQPQPQPLQRQGTIRIQEQQAQYESQQPQQQQQAANFDSQSQQGRQQQPQQHFHYPSNSPQSPYQQAGEPRIVTSQLATSQQLQNPETVSQLSHDSPVTDSDPRSAFAHPQLHQAQGIHHGSTPPQDGSANSLSSQGASLQGQDQSAMPPPAPGGGPPSTRRGQEPEKGLRGQADTPSGPPPAYHRQGSMSLNAMSPAPPPGQGAMPNPGHREDREAQNIDVSPGVDQGRNSPQPSDRDPELEKQFKDLLTKYKNVKRLYFDGRTQVELLNSQVEQLQNAVANQRMSQSRTAWDDNEYSTRSNRLNGAINNLAFNIRKDWRSLPPWLGSFVSADALKTGKQEMTAVGRAAVSRWLVEEFFNKCFHPALDTPLSAQLKEIELSIRGNSYTMHSQEEFDALTTKIVNWRMATLDGLQKRLGSAEAAEHRAMLTNKVTTNLTAYLYQHLTTPPPPGVEGSTSMIAELAVAIAANLPVESRDVAIMYPLPGDPVQTSIMEVEKTGLPPLEMKKDVDGDSDSDEDEDGKDKGGKTGGDKGKPGLSKDLSKVRFAGFVALEVRGRQVLTKAPVWTM